MQRQGKRGCKRCREPAGKRAAAGPRRRNQTAADVVGIVEIDIRKRKRAGCGVIGRQVVLVLIREFSGWCPGPSTSAASSGLSWVPNTVTIACWVPPPATVTLYVTVNVSPAARKSTAWSGM